MLNQEPPAVVKQRMTHKKSISPPAMKSTSYDLYGNVKNPDGFPISVAKYDVKERAMAAFACK